MWHQYFVNDFFVPIWPNLAASFLIWFPLFLLHHRNMVKQFDKLARKIENKHELEKEELRNEYRRSQGDQ